MFKHQLGDRVRDVVTGYTGIVTCRSEHINGCIRYGVQNEKLSDKGTPTESEWFDEAQLQLKKAGVVVIQIKRTGGPRPEPKMDSNPR